jgi:hypothetical protein
VRASPGTVRFSDGVRDDTNVFLLVKLDQVCLIRRAGAPSPQVWPHLGPVVLLLELRHRGYEIASRGFLFTEIPYSLCGSHLGDRVGAEAEGE